MKTYVEFIKESLSDAEKMEMVQTLYAEATPLQKAYFDSYCDERGFGQDDGSFIDNKWVASGTSLWTSDIGRFSMDNRKLDWVATEPMDLDDAIDEFTESVPGYNEFEPSLLRKLPNLFQGRNIQIYPAREGSVCVYVIGEPSTRLEKIRVELNADEVSTHHQPNLTGRTTDDWVHRHYQSKEYLEGTTRIWWD